MTDIKNSIRTVPDFPIKGIQFRDITGLVEDPESFNKSLIELLETIKTYDNYN